MRVLVTGHHGYIGSVLAPFIAAAGHDVVGLDTDLYAACDFGEPDVSIPSLRVDIRDVRAADLEGFDAVVHLAALSNDPLGDLRPGLTTQINFDGERSGSRRRRGKPASAASCSRRRARCTARPGPTTRSTRTRHCDHSRRTRSRRFDPRKACSR